MAAIGKIRGGDSWLVRHPIVREELIEFEGMEYYHKDQEPVDIRKLYRYALEYTVQGDAEALASCLAGIWIGTTWERTQHDYADSRNNVVNGNASLMRSLHDRPSKSAPALYHTVKFGAYETSWDATQPPAAIASTLADAVHGDTLLHIACRRGHTEVTNELLSGGADPHAKNGEGHTPSDVACSELSRGSLQLPPADPMLAKIRAEFDAIAEAVVPCLPTETAKCDQLLQRLVELGRTARRFKVPEIAQMDSRLDRLVEMAYAAHKAKLQSASGNNESREETHKMEGLVVSPLILFRSLSRLLSAPRYDHEQTGEIDRSAAVAALNKHVVELDDATLSRVLDTAQQLGGTEAKSTVNSSELLFVLLGLSQGIREQSGGVAAAAGFPPLHELSERMLERYLTQLFRLRQDVQLWDEFSTPIVSRKDLSRLLSMSKLRLPGPLVDLLGMLGESEDGEISTSDFISMVRSVAAGIRIAHGKDQKVEPKKTAVEKQVDLIEKMQEVQPSLREGGQAWTMTGDCTASAQLSLLHTALLQQDEELLGQGTPKEPQVVFHEQMDTDVLTAQADSLMERRKLRDTAKEIFGIMDEKQDGRVSQDDCCQVLGERLGDRLHNQMASADGTVSFNDWIGYFDAQGKRAANNGAANERDYLRKVSVFVSAMRDRLRAMPGVQN